MKRRTKAFFGVLLVLAILGGAAALTVTFYGKKYVRAEDTAFTVLQITDVHILNDEKKDAKAFKTITQMIEKTKPDMIAVTVIIRKLFTFVFINNTLSNKFSQSCQRTKSPVQ